MARKIRTAKREETVSNVSDLDCSTVRVHVRNSRTDRARELHPTLNREYIVPVLMKSMQIIELLASQPSGLRVEQIHRRTNIAKSTVYRIVRTLVVCGSIVDLGKGTYSIAIAGKPSKL
jgi:Fe2+ or Zn2+ uptake regulation protein